VDIIEVRIPDNLGKYGLVFLQEHERYKTIVISAYVAKRRKMFTVNCIQAQKETKKEKKREKLRKRTIKESRSL